METNKQMWSGCSVAAIDVFYEKGEEHVNEIGNSALSVAGSVGNLIGERTKGPAEYGKMKKIHIWFHTPAEPDAFILEVTDESSALLANGDEESLSLSLNDLWGMTFDDISSLLEEHAEFLNDAAYILPEYDEEDDDDEGNNDDEEMIQSWEIVVSDPVNFIEQLQWLLKRDGTEKVEDYIRLRLTLEEDVLYARLITDIYGDGYFPAVEFEIGDIIDSVATTLHGSVVDVFVFYNAFMKDLECDPTKIDSIVLSYDEEESEDITIEFQKHVVLDVKHCPTTNP